MLKHSAKSRPLNKKLISDMKPVEHDHGKRIVIKTPSLKSVVIFLLIVALALGIWRFTSKPLSPNEFKLETVKASISNHMILPKGEEPTFAVVEDKTSLLDPFLVAYAENKDQVLVYTNSRLAVIYRPSVDRIVAVGNVTADLALPEADGATVVVFNGANDTLKTEKIISKLRELYPKMKVASGGPSKKQDFPNTIIIDNTNVKDELVEVLLKALPAKPGVVPLSEAKSSTDLMIIVGKD